MRQREQEQEKEKGKKIGERKEVKFHTEVY